VVRALSPHIGAYLQLDGSDPLGVLDARAVPGAPAPVRGVLADDGELPLLGCADGALALVTVKPAGKRQMSGEAYLRGHQR